MEKRKFIGTVGPIAKREEEKSGILASLTIAQAILESGWGESGLAKHGKALFGIKAGRGWAGKVYDTTTQEQFDANTMVTIRAAFRAYDSWEDSIVDHTNFLLLNSRYENLIGEKDYRRACRKIQLDGYATALNYAESLIAIIEQNKLTEWEAWREKNEKTERAKEIHVTNTGGKMIDTVFIKKLKDVFRNYRTVYAYGCFGCPITPGIIRGKAKQYPWYYTAKRTEEILAAGRNGAFGFDCVNLIKGILWGWNGDRSKAWGGANYASNGVPDISADGMIQRCRGVSTDFRNIIPGEAVWLPGHIGVYIGEGKVIECTPIWNDGVQITACHNIGRIAGFYGRTWKKHGKIPYIAYTKRQTEPSPLPTEEKKKSEEEIAREVIDGKWGNGQDRKNRLHMAGYDSARIQRIVNQFLKNPAHHAPRKSEEEIAKEVIQGKWGNGQDRKNRLRRAGYNPGKIQRIVNQRLANQTHHAPRKSEEVIAREVIQGKWGNGMERFRKLSAAGYNPRRIQQAVNRMLQR